MSTKDELRAEIRRLRGLNLALRTEIAQLRVDYGLGHRATGGRA